MRKSHPKRNAWKKILHKTMKKIKSQQKKLQPKKEK